MDTENSLYYYVNIDSIGAVLEAPKHARIRTQRNIAMHTHISHELYLLYEGEAKIVTENQEVALQGGQAALICPNTYHAITNVSKSFRLASVYFQLFKLSTPQKTEEQEINMLLESLKSASVLLLGEQPELLRLLRYFSDEQENPGLANDHLLETYTKEMLIHLLRALPSPSETFREVKKKTTTFTSIAQMNRMQIIDEYIYFHCANASIVELAQILAISEQHLRRFLKATYKMSFSELLNRQRIQICKHLLQTTSIPVNEICQQVGFRSYQHFFIVFKRYTGMTATAYRGQFR